MKPHPDRNASAEKPPTVEVRELDCVYDQPQAAATLALSSIDLTIRQGSFVVVSGPNGAGKTTLLNCISGVVPKLLPASLSGSILIEGEDIEKLQTGELAKKIGVVLEDPDTQIFGSTVDQYLAFGMELLAFTREEMVARLEEVAEIVGISSLLSRRCHGLSGGEKQRMVIASMLVMKPKIMILDEPTSQLDPVGTREVFTALMRLNQERGLTVVVASHKISELAPMATDLVVLEKGRLRANGPFQKVLAEELQELVFYPDAAVLYHTCLEEGLVGPVLPPTTVDEGAEFVKTLLNGKKPR